MKRILLIDGPNVLLYGLKITDTGIVRVRSGLTVLAQKILETPEFDEDWVEIFCDCGRNKRTKETFNGFCLIFCPKYQGGADRFLLNRAVSINKSQQKIKIAIVTNDKGLRMRILYALPIEKSSLVKLLTVEEFREKIQN